VTNAVDLAANEFAEASPVPRQLTSHGLQRIDREEVLEWFNDPRYAAGTIVFVDARNDANYLSGHIPGARQFDHYRAERYLAAVLPACLSAERVVVYCTGESCDDSEYAALALRDAGVPQEKLFVYVGGISDWTAHGLPVERESGIGPAAAPR
jgi:rhodanese-related sulfurtransferase